MENKQHALNAARHDAQRLVRRYGRSLACEIGRIRYSGDCLAWFEKCAANEESYLFGATESVRRALGAWWVSQSPSGPGWSSNN